jgi:crotonobetainyl-CoA:carnitine CoA-transferase CaiB-like acyl-CoA transferase
MVAAPYCGKLLADLGADVLKVEPPIGDPARRRGPFPDDVPHAERSGLFLYLNTSKRAITLNLETETGREILRKLAARIDVLIEDRAPGELESAGLGRDRLARTNPRLIVISITPFGQTGPYRSYRSHHLNLYHASGHSASLHLPEGGEGRAPPRGGGYLGEYDAGLTAALATLAAVLGRDRGGPGTHVDVSKQEALMCLERVDLGRAINDPESLRRRMVGGLTRAKDGYFVITPIQNHQWQALVRAMGDPEWSRAEWCQTEAGRMEHRDEIRPRIEEWAAGLTRDEIYHLTQAEGAPTGPIRDVAEVRAWKQTEARGFFAEIDHPEAGAQVYPTAPYQFSRTLRAATPAPCLGQHNEEVYCDRLGYSRGELSRLAEAGIV